MAENARLLRHFLAQGGPESGPWNVSPELAYVTYCFRSWFREACRTKRGALEVCNVGIGAGEWDDFLGYELLGRGSLVSVDIDPEICDLLRMRQRAQRHPNRARVLCRDVLRMRSRARFDIVTIVGSTLAEIGNYEAGLEKAVGLLKPRGRLFYTDFERLHPRRNFPPVARRQGVRILRRWSAGVDTLRLYGYLTGARAASR